MVHTFPERTVKQRTSIYIQTLEMYVYFIIHFFVVYFKLFNNATNKTHLQALQNAFIIIKLSYIVE